MKLNRNERLIVTLTTGIAIAATVVAIPRSHPKVTHRPTAPTAVTVAYPVVIPLPAELAHAIGQARVAMEARCIGGKAYAWAEISEAGHVDDIITGCAPIARAEISTRNVPDGKCHEDDPCWSAR